MDKNEAHVIEDNKKESIKKIEKTIKKKDNLALRKMVVVSLICILFMMAEIIGGLLANSLAIITDAAHLFSDLSGFLISIFAIMIGQKPANKIFTFGYHRAEVLGALTSVITIWILTGFLIKEAIDRLANPSPIDSKIMLITSIFGLLCNLVMMQVLHSDLSGGHGHTGCTGHNHGHVNIHNHEDSCLHEKETVHNDKNETKQKGNHKILENNNENKFNSKHEHHDCRNEAKCDGLDINIGKCSEHNHNHNHHNYEKCEKVHENNNYSNNIEVKNKGNLEHVHKQGICDGHEHHHEHHTHKENNCRGHVEHNHKNHCEGNQIYKESKCGDYEHSHDHKDLNGGCIVAIINKKEINSKVDECCDHSHLIKKKNDKPEYVQNHDRSIHIHHNEEENVNVTAAMIHIIGDIIQSVGVVIASLIIYYYPDMVIVDPICTFFFSVIVFFTTINITKTCISILMESCPDKYQVEKIEIAIKNKFSDIISIHEFHIWSLSTNNFRASLHIVSFNKNLTGEVSNYIKKKYKIDSITIQIESPEDDEELLNCLNKQ